MAYPSFTRLDTRWNDNDVYGHVNNVVYYAFFDTAVNKPPDRGGLSRHPGEQRDRARGRDAVPVLQADRVPDVVHAGMRVTKLGTSSVRYEIGLFANDDDGAAAQGHFVHVYVDRATGRPVAIPDPVRRVLQRLMPRERNDA
jgi:acyl-CoA thioester hydrolase